MLSRNLISNLRGIASKAENLTIRAGLDLNPGKVAFVEDTRTYSYGDFMNRTGQYVNILNNKYGIGKGDRVLARTTKSIDSVALYIACLRLGAIYIPVNPAYTRNETAHYVKDSAPKLLVTCDEATDLIFREQIPNVIREQVLAKETRNKKPEMEVENVDSDDVACVCYTSGTTGLPKGAMLTHGSLSTNAEALVENWRFTHDDKLLHTLPFYHVHGMFISLNCSFFSHSTVVWRDKFNVDDALKWMPHCTVFMGVPTYYTRLLNHPMFTTSAHRAIRLFVSGSAPLSLPMWEQFRSTTGHTILERYGMTEAQVICSNLYDVDGRKPGSVGKPLRGTKLRINSTGGIEIQSDALFAGYWKNPERTKKEFTDDGYFITGDVGEFDNQGFIKILGRSKDLVITGGLNVYPKEIEDVIDKLDEVAESAIIGVPHKEFGEAVVAVIVTKNPVDREAFTTKAITHLREQLSGYKVPKKVVFLQSLPRNSMAKVQKNVLREQFKDSF
ncbi:unnamed protein product [Auanema sp. JU1783]|nr:unnamed protein product [Auanema sp. JU1783]